MFTVLFTMLNVDLKDPRYNIDTRAEMILSKLDTSGDRALSREEFIIGCMNDEPLRKLLLDHYL